MNKPHSKLLMKSKHNKEPKHNKIIVQYYTYTTISYAQYPLFLYQEE
jgi:hypothetical protein